MITNKDTFCFWDATNDINVGFIIFNIVIALFLIVLMVRNFLKSKPSGITKFYVCLFIWATFFSTQAIFSLVIYYQVYQNYGEQQKTDPSIKQFITKISTVYKLLDSIPAFILQTLLFLIPLHMIRNVMNIIRSYGYILEDKEQFWYKRLKQYQYFRFIIIIPNIFLIVFLNLDLNLLERANRLEYTTITIVVMVCIDCLICTAVLIRTYKYLNNKYSVLKIDNQEDKRKFKKQCYLLGTSALGRFLIDLFFIGCQIYFLNIEESQPLCISPAPTGLRLAYTIIYNFLGTFLMHFFPVYTTIRMYKPKQE